MILKIRYLNIDSMVKMQSRKLSIQENLKSQILINFMITSKECSIGNHKLCTDISCECGCHSNLNRSPSEKIEEDSAYMEGIPGPE